MINQGDILFKMKPFFSYSVSPKKSERCEIMKITYRVNKQIRQHIVEQKATEELIQQRLENKNIEKEREKRAIELKVIAKADGIARDWIAYDLHLFKMKQWREARKEKDTAIAKLRKERIDKREAKKNQSDQE